MRIHTKLKLIGLLPLLALVVGGVSLLITQWLVEGQRERAALADELSKQVNELTIVSYQFAFSQQARPQQQWLTTWEGVDALLKRGETAFDSVPWEKTALGDIRYNLDHALRYYREYVQILDSAGREAVSGVQRDYLGAVARRLLIELQGIPPLTQTLHELHHRNALRLGRLQNQLGTGLLVLLAVGSALLVLPMAQQIGRALRRLQGSIHIVAAGDLTHRARSDANDEIGEVSRLFDTMTAQLQTITVSRGELERSESLLAEAQRLAQLGSWELDLANGKLQWSGEIYRIFELDPAQFHPSYETFLDCIHPEDRDSVHRAFADSLEQHTPYRVEYRLRFPDGRLKQVREQGETIYDEDGVPLRSLSTVQDITESKNFERALLEARDAAEAASRAKSAFLATMSHELRTPLNAILGFAHLLQSDPITPSQRRGLGTIERSGQHLLTLINDVLEISRIEAGRVRLERSSFDLSALISGVEEMVALRAANKGLELAVETGRDLPAHVLGDPHRLRQVLINLLTNAVKYTDTGTVRFGVRRAEGDRISFEVADTGPGISAEEQEAVFTPFYQTAHGQAKGDGTGLGLAISRDHVRMMGGDLELESAPGRGSRFHFTLPLPETEVIGDPAAYRQVVGLEEGQPGCRVLVVEDNEANRALLTQLLEGAGFEVREAGDGAAGVALAECWQPHFIWMDMRMPVMDGYEATRRIRAIHGFDRVRIAALTASVFQEDEAKVITAGCDAFLRKPLRESEVFRVMGELLGVRYRYSAIQRPEPPQPPERSALRSLPEALRDQLGEAAEGLNGRQVRLLADRLEAEAQAPQLAAWVRHLAEEYRFEELAKWVEGGEDEG